MGEPGLLQVAQVPHAVTVRSGKRGVGAAQRGRQAGVAGAEIAQVGFVDHARFRALRAWRTHRIPAGGLEIIGIQVDHLGVLAVA